MDFELLQNEAAAKYFARSITTGDGIKALIVDDHAEDLNLLKYNLEWHGYQVFEAGNSLEALEQARREIPDLIVSDALMPVMDGFMLLREVKADPEGGRRFMGGNFRCSAKPRCGWYR